MENTTVAAISTALGSGGIGVIRISGDDAIVIADKVFKSINNKKLKDLKGYNAVFGHIYDEFNQKIDECVALVFKAPNSYTGENVVEISCHGGIFITKEVLRTIINSGALPAPAGEFTKRAFLNGKIDLAQAESVMDLIKANSKNAAREALLCKDGKISKKIDEIASVLINSASHLCAWADYPEDDIPEVTHEQLHISLNSAKQELKNLIENYDKGKIVREGVDTLIVGKPNVGKSTIMNLLSGFEKSIVTDIEGTTRDIIEESVNIGSLVLNLSDTAGLRETDNPVEKIGVQKARDRMENCGLILAVFDGSQKLNLDDKKLLLSLTNTPCIAVINKTDKGNEIEIEYINQYIKNIVQISAKNNEGVDDLVEKIEKITGTADFNPSSIILTTERQRNAVMLAFNSLNEAIDSLKIGMTLDAVTVTIEDTISKLLEITGKTATEKVVEKVFESFCVGK